MFTPFNFPSPGFTANCLITSVTALSASQPATCDSLCDASSPNGIISTLRPFVMQFALSSLGLSPGGGTCGRSFRSHMSLHIPSIRPGPPAARITLARCMRIRWETQRVLQPTCNFSCATSIHLVRVCLSPKLLYLACNHPSFGIYNKFGPAAPRSRL
ncbi:hypothetical protein LZ31DRAFT_338775 [Colletotrichum somersetense]|nr:hypothetical protein LZ31DRAFT_338775 [Colletotrichum somersetense]